MSEVVQYTRREGLSIVVPSIEQIVCRATGVDEYVIELDGLPLWSDGANLAALEAKIHAALTARSTGDGR